MATGLQLALIVDDDDGGGGGWMSDDDRAAATRQAKAHKWWTEQNLGLQPAWLP